MTALATPTATIPDSIWMPGGEEPSVYRGSPLEMVRTMASEMGLAEDTRSAVTSLLDALASNRHVKITIRGSNHLDERTLAQAFVQALLVSGLARPLPHA